MESEYEYSNDHKEDNIKDALINENKEEINININSDIDSENIDNRDENIINELEDFEPNIKNKKHYNNQKYGLANKAYFLEKYQQNQGNIFNKNDFILRDVKSDGNCGYRCISLQLYGEEDKYYIIRENVYKLSIYWIYVHSDLFFFPLFVKIFVKIKDISNQNGIIREKKSYQSLIF